MGLAGSVTRVWFCLCCSLWFEVFICCHSLPCAHQSLSHRQLLGTIFLGAEESRREGEEGSSGSNILPSFYHLLLLWRTAFLDCLDCLDCLNFGRCELLFNAVTLIHSSLASIRDDGRQEMALLPSDFSTSRGLLPSDCFSSF